LLARYEAEGDNFLSTTVTGDETWIHHFEPEKKKQSMEWHHTTCPRKERFKAIPSASKIMVTVFWNCEGVIFIDVLPRGQMINSDVYVETEDAEEGFPEGWSHKDVTKVLIHDENARPHTCLHTREAITKLPWAVLPHPPYSSDLAPSDYHLFSPLKDAIRGRKFEDDEEVISEVKRWLRQRPAEWYGEGMQAVSSRWRKAIVSDGKSMLKKRFR
jgi:histone-lysine N-methyltransferase SETMAR